MTITQAEKKMRNAGTVGLVLLILKLMSLVSDFVGATRKGDIFALPGSAMADIVAVVLLSWFMFGLHKKSRVAAIAMFTCFLVPLGMIVYFLVSHLAMRAVISQDDTIAILIATVIITPILYFSFEGARGTLTYHRLQAHSSADQPVASLED
jgi:hypothetical protein